MGMPPNADAAVERLAHGGLRGDADTAWRLMQSAWTLLERFVLGRLSITRAPPLWRSDCGQNVFVRIWMFRHGYRGASEAEFWTWIRRICDNERRRIQSRQRMERLAFPSWSADGPSSSPPLSSADPLEDAAMGEALRRLKDCLILLPDRHQRIIAWTYFPPELSERAIAVLLGVSPSRVHKLKTDALGQLRECMRQHDTEM